MTIPRYIKIKHKKLPITPGVYLFKNKKGKVVYVGKATNLKSRVGSYFNGRRGSRTIDEMLHEVTRIEYVVTDSVIEALILEANLIRKYMPAYNVKEKDDKSFLYVAVTREKWPKPVLVRGQELATSHLSLATSKTFGPFTSASSIRAALDIMRKIFPWSTCKPGQGRSCFDYHIGRCPGVCVGAVTRKEYLKNIRNLVLFFENKKSRVIKNVEKEMKVAAKEEQFEEAEKLKRKLFALRHIRDVAVITNDRHSERSEESRAIQDGRDPSSASGELRMTSSGGAINILGRIEGYDISNISGVAAVGSMVVFENGEAAKSEYRKFKIKTVVGINDVAMIREVLERRFKDVNIKSWGTPDLIFIDGGWGQVNVAEEVLAQYGLKIPVVGIAKGFDRKQDRPVVYSSSEVEKQNLMRIIAKHKDLLLRVRDEAHRFAITYHRKRMRKRLST